MKYTLILIWDLPPYYDYTGRNDFVLLNDLLTFPEDSRPADEKCFQVLVLGDNFIETDEMFAINISTFFPDLIGSPGSVLVTISRDGDSKFILQAISTVERLGFCPP